MHTTTEAGWKTTAAGIIVPASTDTRPAQPKRSAPNTTTREKLAALRAEFAGMAEARRWRAAWETVPAWAGMPSK